MTDYNLTWEEAKEAMKRGAVIESGIYTQHRMVGGCIQYGWNVTRWSYLLDITDAMKNDVWRIVELTDCEISELGVIYGMNHLECNIHNWSSAYLVNCESKHIPKFKQECINTIKNNCIQKFTEQLKKDIEKGKENMSESRVKTCKASEFERGKSYKPVGGTNFPIIALADSPGMFWKFFVNGSWVTPGLFNEISPQLRGQLIRSSRYIEVSDPDVKKDKKITNIEEGKFYSWGQKTTIFKIDNGTIYRFEKISHSPEWIASEEFNLLDVTNLEEVENPEKMQEPKKYSFEKALSGMRHGKFYKDSYVETTYGLIDGKLFYYRHPSKTWEPSTAPAAALVDLNFIEVDNPDKKDPEIKYNGLALSSVGEEGAVAIFNIELAGFSYKIFIDSDDKKPKLTKAFATFLKLKAHPLAVKPMDVSQWYIRVNDKLNIIIDDYCIIKFKSTEISPSFNSKEDARQAIQDIGEKNLVEMFKVFSGVYE